MARIPSRLRQRVFETLKFWGAFAAVGVIVAGVAVSCNQVIMTAPPGSTITLFANPEFIPAHGGVSEIVAFVMESTGSPVADGTVVQFFTSLGRIEEQGRTNDGVARVKLVSDSRSGTAKVTAFSGGGSVTSGGGATPTATGTGATPAPTSGGGGGSVTGTINVKIGNVLPAVIWVNAVPSRITSSRSADIIATVLDADGNPVPNVEVFFSVELARAISPIPTATGTATATPTSATPAPSSTANERLDSSGNPVWTDNNGRAVDKLRTIAFPGGAPYIVEVTARVVVGGRFIEGSTNVIIN